MAPSTVPNLEDLTLLCAVVAHGNFSAAARHCGTTQPRVSRAIQRLEERLGMVLVQRDSRRVAPTPEGIRYADHARQLLVSLADMEGQLQGLDALDGPLSVSAPPALGRRLLLDAMAAFGRTHTGVTLNLSLASKRVDLIGQAVDVAIRFGPLPDTWRRARLLVRGHYHIYGAPGLFDGDAPPSMPEGLSALPCLVLHATELRNRWPVTVDGEIHWAPVVPALLTDDVEALIGFMVRGMGVSILPDFLVSEEVQSGALIALTEDGQGVPAEVFAVTPGFQHPRAKAFVDHLVASRAD